MAVDADNRGPFYSAPADDASRPSPDAEGLLSLTPGERVIQSLDADGGARFFLTNRRIHFIGGHDGDAVYSTAHLKDVTTVEVTRRERERRSAWWGLIGVAAAIGVWQVTASDLVGNIAGAVVGAFAVALLLDYWLRPPGFVLRVHTAGGTVWGPVSKNAAPETEEFALRLEEARQAVLRASNPGGPYSAWRHSGGYPYL